jgi:tricorn protease
MTPTTDRRTIFYTQASNAGPGNEIHRMAIATPQRKERVNFSFSVEVDRRGEWEQIFEESWRVMKYRFYDEKMHGVDWDAIKQPVRAAAEVRRRQRGRVRPGERDDRRAERVAHRRERPVQRVRWTAPYATRLLGFELEPADGRYRISAHLPGRTRRPGVARPEGRRLRARHRRHRR